MTSAAAEVMMSVGLSGRKNIYMKLFLSVCIIIIIISDNRVEPTSAYTRRVHHASNAGSSSSASAKHYSCGQSWQRCWGKKGAALDLCFSKAKVLAFISAHTGARPAGVYPLLAHKYRGILK